MNFIQKLAQARQNALMNTYGMTSAEAQAKVDNELKLLTNAPATTGDASNAGDYIPESVMLSNVVDTSLTTPQLWSFLGALTSGRQPLQSLNNLYPVIGETIAAGGTTEWSTGGFYDGKEPTEEFTAGTITISPVGVYAAYGVSRELAMYSMVDLIPLALRKLNEGIMLNIATSIINGDNRTNTSNINCLGVAPSTALVRGVKNAVITRDGGLRKLLIAGSAGVTKIDVGTPAGADDIFDAMKLLSFGGTPSDFVMIMNTRTYYTYMKSDDFKDASRNGVSSTISTGAMTNIAGIDLFVTDLLPLTASNGNVDATTPANNVKGSIIIMKRNVIQHGFFGSVKFDTKEDIQKGFLVEAVADFGFANISTLNGQTNAVLLHNIDVA